MHEAEMDAYCALEPAMGAVTLVSSIDPWLHNRRQARDYIEANVTIPFGKSMTAGNSLVDLDSHAIVRDGRIIGIWEFDHGRQEIAAWTFDGRDKAVDSAIDEASDWIKTELGDFRSFSLDSPKSRQPRIEQIRRLAS
jgi:hypothetical protein